MAKKSLEIDMIAGSMLRDTQGETLSVEGADIDDLLNGKGRINDNHGKGFFNSIGRITEAKKILKEEDCDNDRHRYYWDKIKTPFIYAKGYLYNDEDHPNAKAAAAILRNIHKTDVQLKLKASVEGGVVSRGIKDPSLLARTKIHSVALTFTPANNATLVEPISLDKNCDEVADMQLIKSVVHLAETNVPSFRHIARDAQATKVRSNLEKLSSMLNAADIPLPSKEEIMTRAIEEKVANNVVKINQLIKALTAGYGGASSPTNRVGAAVIQSESLECKPGFKYVTCDSCGKEQVYSKYQVKCRECNKSFSLDKLSKIFLKN